jgi:hypothetical protein
MGAELFGTGLRAAAATSAPDRVIGSLTPMAWAFSAFHGWGWGLSPSAIVLGAPIAQVPGGPSFFVPLQCINPASSSSNDCQCPIGNGPAHAPGRRSRIDRGCSGAPGWSPQAGSPSLAISSGQDHGPEPDFSTMAMHKSGRLRL